MLMIKERTNVASVTDDVGQRIKDRRARLGMSVKGLAERAGVDRGRLAEIEAGTATNVRPATLGAIERALDDLEREAERADVPELPEGFEYIGDPAEEFIAFEVGEGPTRVVVKGLPKDADLLREQARKLVEEAMRSASERDRK